MGYPTDEDFRQAHREVPPAYKRANAIKPRRAALRTGMRVWIPGVVAFVQKDAVYVQATNPEGTAVGDKVNERKPSDFVLKRRYVKPRRRSHTSHGR